MFYFYFKKTKKKKEKSKADVCVLSGVSFVADTIRYSRKLEIIYKQ